MSVVKDRDAVFDAALQLSEPDRLDLATRLLETLPDDMPGLESDCPDFHAELLQRSGDVAESVPWQQLRDELKPPT
jgi:hypothetical protein